LIGAVTGLVFLFLLGAAAAAQQAASSYVVYFGSAAKGFYAYHFSPATGALSKIGVVGAEIDRPTAFASDPANRFLYVTSEVGNDGKAEGAIFSYRMDARTGALTAINKVMAGGGGTTFLAEDKTARVLIADNYGGGSVAVFRLNADGSIGERTALIVQSAGGREAHPHHAIIAADNRHVIVPDLGMDRVYTYILDPAKASLTPANPAFVTVPDKYTPRHFAFDPKERFGYLIDQNEAAITQFAYNKKTGELKIVKTVSMLPQNFTGTKSGADIWVAPSGKFLYASCRSDNTLQVYSIDPKDGTLKLIQRINSGGKSPRAFGVDPTGQNLLVVNQQSDNVTVFRIDQASGKLTTGQTESMPVPASVFFVATAKK
jgi:6-phosphogluconolactonase